MSQHQADATANSAELSEEMPVTRRFGDFFQLTKPRLNMLVLTTTFVGYFVGSNASMNLAGLFHAMFGTAMVAGGASVLNMYFERELDARMDRTAARPIPMGKVSPGEALTMGLLMGIIGTAWLYVAANPLTALLGALSYVTYVWVYTPMKVRSTFNTAVGAISGALPPMMGWTAAQGHLGLEAIALFAILFLWQHPHFFALAWMYRADYEQGGYKMLPAVDPEGDLSARLVFLFSLALVPVTLMLTLTGTAGYLFALGSVLLAGLMIRASVGFVRDRSVASARKVFRASLVYLPALLALLMLDMR